SKKFFVVPMLLALKYRISKFKGRDDTMTICTKTAQNHQIMHPIGLYRLRIVKEVKEKMRFKEMMHYLK
ncbi:6368_t:CDS:1, partial [Funneliformis caledonium]